jgi:hypothetical protein
MRGQVEHPQPSERANLNLIDRYDHLSALSLRDCSVPRQPEGCELDSSASLFSTPNSHLSGAPIFRASSPAKWAVPTAQADESRAPSFWQAMQRSCTVYLLAEPRVSFMIRYAVALGPVTKRGIDSPFGLTIILAGAAEVFPKVAQKLPFGVRRL